MEDNITSSTPEGGILLIKKLYKQCLQLAWQLNNSSAVNNTDSPPQCPVIFDGFTCWGPTKINTTDYKPCPSYVIGFNGNSNASKVCLENGSWYTNPNTGQHWTNYLACVDHEDYTFRQTINDIYFYGYCVSLSTLIISLVIFLSFRSLKCTRIKIHVQLFISLAMSCILWIIWYKFIIIDPNIVKENSLGCIGLHIVLQYLMICNYFWMFCEGLHLHLVLVVVFIKDNVAMRIFFIIGWLLPLLIITAYSLMRMYNTVDNNLCWIEESHYQYILTIPVLISFICSIIFLVNIVRVLITKLHPKSEAPPPLAIKKAVRATLILIPLFGLQHVLIPFRPEKGSSFESIYQIVSAVFVSLQGLCVSCLFCFANHEVISAVFSYLSSIFPMIFKTSSRENYNNLGQPTTTRDIVL
ncbi:hypothetical protein PVAND_002557 [Polypedilum vanderplanki]|uniref:Uncharacterized protein n=1 Tax=Polypedilum vanderplanki TaxID=319348 RepID=A0A9J6BRD0_POLVA|nr:hypothetical protein PVAND_002557 [Polypedilum vanderplanki]